MIDITNRILTQLKNLFPSVTVTGEYTQDNELVFPVITLRELENTTFTETVSSAGEEHSALSFEINIFSNSKNKITDVKELRNSVDNIMSSTYNMNRTTSTEVRNYADVNVYRWVLRYSCVVDNNLTIYRG